MNGWIDVIRIEDGEVVLSKELKHITGNITIILRTQRENEIMLGTQRGVYFAHVGRGLGLMEVEMERFDKSQTKLARLNASSDERPAGLRELGGSERAEVTTLGPKYADLEGMSQMSYQTHS